MESEHTSSTRGAQGHQVSIIIPNWNGGKTLKRCLESILFHTTGVDFELIVVDNGSGDESRSTADFFSKQDFRVKVLHNEENLYFAKACNQGYKISSGRYVLIANNDILLIDDAVSRMVDYATRAPESAVVTPRFVGADLRPQEFFRRLPKLHHVLAHYRSLGRAIDRLLLGRRIQDHYFYRDRNFNDIEDVEQAGASFSLFRREAIERVGYLFDEAFPLLFNDVDLYRRIKDCGFQSRVIPSIQVVHLGGVSSRKLDPARFRQLQDQGMFGYFRKHHPIQYRLLMLLSPIRWLRSMRRNDITARW